MRPSLRADVALICLGALLGGLFLVDSAGPSWSVTDLVVGAVACCALLVRRRWPVTLAVVLIPSLMLSASSMGPTALALGAVALYRSWRVAAAVLALHALTVATLFGLAPIDRREFWQGLTVVLALDVTVIASGLLVRSQHLLVRSLRERAHEAEEGHRLRLEEARHAERERIAREMHDVLAHRISLLAVHAGALEVRRSAPDEERQAAAIIRQCAYGALEDLREVIGMLRDDYGALDLDRPQPTLADLAALIEQSRLAGARITLDNGLVDLPPAPDGIGRHVYRIVQEGLTNARKHAPGAPVSVRLVRARQPAAGLLVEVTNPLQAGTALPQIPGAGSGLVGLNERMNLVGGQLEHGPTPDGEFRLHAWLPWRA